jgi:hypothetical protein
MKILLIILIFLTACSASVPTVEKKAEHEFKISGKLDQYEYDKIIDIVKSNPNQTVIFYVTSYGGTSNHLFEAMDAVYNHGHIEWYSLYQCDSACAVMALSTKHAHGHFRLHSFFRHYNHKIEASPEFNDKVLNKLSNYGYDKKYLNHMFHSVEELWSFDVDENKIIEDTN